jgi:serine/threonine protein kinase
MSPEQASGRAVCATSDLFSLGAVMYAMCTGHPPFRAETVFGLLKRICEDQPRPIRATNPEIPDWLDPFIRNLLAKDPLERFASAAEVADALADELAYLQNPTGANPPARPWLPKTRRRRRFFSGRVTEVSSLAAVAVCGVLLALPPEISVPQDVPRKRASALLPDIRWIDSDLSVEQLAAEIEGLETRARTIQPAPEVDPWLAEAGALRQRIEELEWQDSMAPEF